MVTIQSPYIQCPIIAGDNLKLRLVSIDDSEDLLQCYSDPNARRLFNSDNCTSTFEYSTINEMQQAIEFWLEEYQKKIYVRFSIVDQKSEHAAGTLEMFTRPANDGRIPIGVLRIDLQSGCESEAVLDELVQIIEANFPNYFAYTAIITKVVQVAEKRIMVFQKHGFAQLSDKNLMDFDDYYVKYY